MQPPVSRYKIKDYWCMLDLQYSASHSPKILEYKCFLGTPNTQDDVIFFSKQDNMQLSPEGEVNSGGYIPRREVSRYYIHRSSPTLRGIVVLVFTKTDG